MRCEVEIVQNTDIQYRGGSRTSPRRGRQSLGGRLPNILVIFSEKPYEIKEISVRRGARAGCAPPKSASAICEKVHTLKKTRNKDYFMQPFFPKSVSYYGDFKSCKEQISVLEKKVLFSHSECSRKSFGISPKRNQPFDEQNSMRHTRKIYSFTFSLSFIFFSFFCFVLFCFFHSPNILKCFIVNYCKVKIRF